MVNGILLCADISFLKFTPIRLFVNMLFIFYFIFFQQKAVDDDIGYNVNRKENVNRHLLRSIVFSRTRTTVTNGYISRQSQKL